MPLESLFALVMASASLLVAIASLAVVWTLPKAPRVLSEVERIGSEVLSANARSVELARAFVQLEEDVQEHLEKAGTRLARAKATESNESRRTAKLAAQAEPEVPTDWEAERLRVESALGSGELRWRL